MWRKLKKLVFKIVKIKLSDSILKKKKHVYSLII